jgi:hypothetical protein
MKASRQKNKKLRVSQSELAAVGSESGISLHSQATVFKVENIYRFLQQ